ncbi:unnamed protein product [Arabis nemorensis]|uniref:Uncharacterized protein n=1 Tax=Arabis nemorensis TaxID=586526 RepID=A0A565AJT9_9BRAS|nr:unnamed protein product [Arabis nemorensis]
MKPETKRTAAVIRRSDADGGSSPFNLSSLKHAIDTIDAQDNYRLYQNAPGANYRCVWALSQYYPDVKTFVRAHDVAHGLNLEKSWCYCCNVVPETLEPSLQLAAAVLAQVNLPTSEIANTINEFRARHLSELTEQVEALWGIGFSRSKPKPQQSVSSNDNQIIEGGILAI